MMKFNDIIRLIFCLVLFNACGTQKETANPSPKPMFFVTMDGTQVLYRGFDSMFEYGANCPNTCETYIKTEGGSAREIDLGDNLRYTAIFKPDNVSQWAIINLYCVCNTDSTLLMTKKYPILELPHPSIYYGGVNLTDYTLYNDTVTFKPGGIYALYDGVPGLMQTNARITECSYTYKNKDYILNQISRAFPASIWNEMKLNESIKFNSVSLMYPDGRYTTLHINREIIKASSIDYNVFILK